MNFSDERPEVFEDDTKAIGEKLPEF